MEQQKKIYTVEDNVKYISFAMKDLVKEIQVTNSILATLVQQLGKDKNHNPDFP